MSLSISGNDLIFDGTVTISNFSNPASVATLTLTPSGGVGSLPALVDGDPGLPPTLAVGTVTTLAAGASATVGFTRTAVGGPGVASAYTVDFGIPVGAAGTAGTNGTLAGCSDVNVSPAAAVGDFLSVASLSPTKFSYTAFPWGFVVNPSTITSVPSTAGQATVQMCSLSIAAQTFNWIPLCLATATVAGTVNTVVNLTATLTAGTRTNDIIGQVFGYAGQATQRLSMNSGFGGLLGSGYGVVAAGDTATIYLKAQETASTGDSWSVSNTTATFTVVGIPVA